MADRLVMLKMIHHRKQILTNSNSKLSRIFQGQFREILKYTSAHGLSIQHDWFTILRNVPEELKGVFAMFVDKGCNHIDEDKNTLLNFYIMLAQPPEVSVVEYLISHCDNIGIKNKDG